MERLRVALLAAFVAVAAIAFAFAGYGKLSPAFTDLEIQASFVDTWGVHALFTLGSSALLLACALFSILLGLGASRTAKRLAVVSAGLAGVAVVLLIATHIELAERTTRLTGQTFGGFYGLF
jgi:hypothetical protein